MIPNPLRRSVIGFALLALAGTVHANDHGNYPNKPINMILPLSVGSAGDDAMRIVAQQMAQNLGVPIVVENRPGVAGLLGSERIARADPDGYVIGGIGDSVLNYAANLSTQLTFDPIEDLAPISLVAEIPWALVVTPDLGANTLSEFIDIAKARPGALDFGSTGMGSASHVAMETLMNSNDIKLMHVPYKGATESVVGTAGGQVQATFAAVSIVLPHIQSGRLKAIGVASEQRSNLLPEVPTFAESGMPEFAFTTWVGMFAPKGTPRPIVDKLSAETNQALQAPAVIERLQRLGMQPKGSTPDELEHMVRSGHERVAGIIKAAGIKIE